MGTRADSTRSPSTGSTSSGSPLDAIVGESAAMRSVKQLVDMVARNHCTVFITGESGVGKELLTQTIHKLSPRADKPLIAANCGALPETLLESQLFGHLKGAFTGATQDTLGIFRAANQGTVFLDEITEMSPMLQVKLLRVLQEREVTPVGSTEPISVDLRILAASNRSLERVREESGLREDLYYRLCVVHIDLPPLRRRREDIALLVHHFVHRHAVDYGRDPLSFAAGAMTRLQEYSWPGNVRELSNTIERLYALSAGPVIKADDLSPHLHSVPPVDDALIAGRLPSWEEAEKALIRRALQATDGQKAAAAKLLKIDRHRLMRKIRKYDIS